MKGWNHRKIGSFSEIGRGSSPRLMQHLPLSTFMKRKNMLMTMVLLLVEN
jgi:hypothetical protein